MRLLLTEAEFGRLRALLAGLAGLVFDESRRESLSYSVAERLAATGFPDAAAYVELVEQTGALAIAERQALLDEVTIQETHFFRNPPQVRALRRHVLPELIRAAAGSDRRLRIWSAGCSTGEEAYSVAMLVRELLPDLTGWDVKILATDLSERALAASRAARYAGRSLQMAEPADLARWFVQEDDAYVVRPDVRRLVEFRQHNLVTDPAPFGAGERVDLVLCRNVTIYFDKDTTRALMGRLHGALADGGYLFLGHAETFWQVSDAFRLVSLGDAFVYRRDDAAALLGMAPRSALPDRRTADEALADRDDRRQPGRERRGSGRDRLPWSRLLPAPRAPVPDGRSAVPSPSPPAATVPARLQVPPPDPLDAVRSAMAMGRYAEAADLAAEVASSDPMLAPAHYLVGLALSNLGRDSEAVVALRKAVYAEPSHGLAQFLLAGVLGRLGEPAAAARCYRAAASALGRTPGDADAAELGGRSHDDDPGRARCPARRVTCRRGAADRPDARLRAVPARGTDVCHPAVGGPRGGPARPAGPAARHGRAAGRGPGPARALPARPGHPAGRAGPARR